MAERRRITASAAVTIEGADGAEVTGMFTADADDSGPRRKAVIVAGEPTILSAPIEVEDSFTFRVTSVERHSLTGVLRSTKTVARPTRVQDQPAQVKVGLGLKNGSPPKEKGVLYVRVENARGEPVAGAEVVGEYRVLQPEGRAFKPTSGWRPLPRGTAPTAPEGTYAARGLPKAVYQFRVKSVRVRRRGREYQYEMAAPESEWRSLGKHAGSWETYALKGKPG